ncbi:MAG: TRAP transporter small permease subunit [Proteobacteria bacterium]|jgi:TRAP-type C4-dicarboxylate transport system permease small subunit|nr:TRAP transporter small permease subunit [Candidatus Fonsibacter sp. PEL5]NKA17009.1 TRAP transporter small permease subunit [Candidatus Fonsibacter sp. PEL55]
MVSASSVKSYDRYLQYFIFLQMIFLSLTVVVGVCFRWSGHSLVWYDEVAGIQLAWITYFGSAYASLKGLHIGMPTLIKVFPKDIRKILFVISKIIIFLFFLILTYYGTKVIIVLRGDTLVTLDWIPQSFVQAVIPASSVLIIISEFFSYEEAYKQTMKD